MHDRFEHLIKRQRRQLAMVGVGIILFGPLVVLNFLGAPSLDKNGVSSIAGLVVAIGLGIATIWRSRR